MPIFSSVQGVADERLLFRGRVLKMEKVNGDSVTVSVRHQERQSEFLGPINFA